MDFHQDFYIPSNKKLAFNLTRVHILGTHHCGKKRREAFKRRSYFQDVLYRRDDA